MQCFILGHPQMVKVVQNSSNQSLAQLKIKPNPVKIIKLPASAEGINKVCGVMFQFSH